MGVINGPKRCQLQLPFGICDWRGVSAVLFRNEMIEFGFQLEKYAKRDAKIMEIAAAAATFFCHFTSSSCFHC